MRYLNKDYILIRQTYRIALTWYMYYFVKFMKNTPCGNSWLMLCMTLEVQPSLMLAEGFTRLQRVLVKVEINHFDQKYLSCIIIPHPLAISRILERMMLSWPVPFVCPSVCQPPTTLTL